MARIFVVVIMLCGTITYILLHCPFDIVCVDSLLYFQGWLLSRTGVLSCLVMTRASESLGAKIHLSHVYIHHLLSAVSLAVSCSRHIFRSNLASVRLKAPRSRVISMMFRRMSYRRCKVALSSALSAVPQSQVGLAFFHRLCNFYSGILLQRKRSFWRSALSTIASESLKIDVSSLRSRESNKADIFLAWIGRRKTLLAYTAIFSFGAVRYFVCCLHLGPLLTRGGTGTANSSKW